MKTFPRISFFFLFTTQFCFGQWLQVGLNGETIKDIAVHNQNIFAVTADTCDGWDVMFNPCLGKLYRSTDNGLYWTMLVDSNVVDVAISTSGKIFKIEKDSVYGFGKSANLYYSLDNGNNWLWSDIEWQLIDSLLYPEEPEKIFINPDGTIFCNIIDSYSDYEPIVGGECTEVMEHAKWRDIIARSTDDGVTWATPGKSVMGGEQFHFDDNLVLTIGHNYRVMNMFPTWPHIYLSSDYGNTWDYIGLLSYGFNNPSTHFLGYFSNDYIFAEASWQDDHALYLSNDTCNTWTQKSTLNIQAGLCWSSGSSEGMLIGTEELGVFIFSDEGDSLGSRNEGLTNLNIKTLTLDNNGYVYAGTENGVWRRPLTDIVTSVETEPTQPAEFILSQSYPNPFNSSCAIRYSIPQLSQVSLKAFNSLGEEIQTLVNEEKPVGTYELNWSAANLPSGVYFFRLQAGGFVQTRKMILLK